MPRQPRNQQRNRMHILASSRAGHHLRFPRWHKCAHPRLSLQPATPCVRALGSRSSTGPPMSGRKSPKLSPSETPRLVVASSPRRTSVTRAYFRNNAVLRATKTTPKDCCILRQLGFEGLTRSNARGRSGRSVQRSLRQRLAGRSRVYRTCWPRDARMAASVPPEAQPTPLPCSV